jgi:hypothetical protein
MDDKEILGRIDELMKTEHELRAQLAAGQLTTDEEHAALRSAEAALDQYWDLLRAGRGVSSRDVDQPPRPVEVEDTQ